MTTDLSRLGPAKTDFMTSFNKALSREGFISSNPADKGGFTYKGISRTKHQTWLGWKIFDNIYRSQFAAANQSVQLLNRNSTLQNEVIKFYREEFWYKIQGDLLPSQLIADELFESSINLGITAASENLQHTINLLNRNTRLYPDNVVDGIIGSQTLSAGSPESR